jgi:hypothetical protein
MSKMRGQHSRPLGARHAGQMSNREALLLVNGKRQH